MLTGVFATSVVTGAKDPVAMATALTREPRLIVSSESMRRVLDLARRVAVAMRSSCGA